jgi:hypothetical protein
MRLLYALLALATLSGCETSDRCGSGTVLSDGVCVVGVPGSSLCGEGTEWDESAQLCIVDDSERALCGADTCETLDRDNDAVCACADSLLCAEDRP